LLFGKEFLLFKAESPPFKAKSPLFRAVFLPFLKILLDAKQDLVHNMDKENETMFHILKQQA
jgi:hypothetical protein